ncbi:MAG: hypothetical protein ACK4UN_05875 [Limisphaerales bacterium]
MFSAALATGTLLFYWFILNLFTHVADTITIDRDIAAGLRIGCLFVALGMILGRAVAGDWVSQADTVADFMKYSTPSAGLLLLAIVLEKFFPPSADNTIERRVLSGGIPGATYIVIAILVLLWKGWWK